MGSALTAISENGLENMGRYYSFYPGIVRDNVDPTNRHCLEVIVPEVQQGVVIWAAPGMDMIGNHFCCKYPTPLVGDEVYVIFRMGNIMNPFWIHKSFIRFEEEIPPQLSSNTTFGLFTQGGNHFWVDDYTGEFHVYTHGDINIRSDGTIIFNQGSNAGMVKIKELTEKLNKLVQEVERLRTLFNSHTHPGVQPGGGITSVTTSPYSQPITQFNKDDYENTKILQ